MNTLSYTIYFRIKGLLASVFAPNSDTSIQYHSYRLGEILYKAGRNQSIVCFGKGDSETVVTTFALTFGEYTQFLKESIAMETARSGKEATSPTVSTSNSTASTTH